MALAERAGCGGCKSASIPGECAPSVLAMATLVADRRLSRPERVKFSDKDALMRRGALLPAPVRSSASGIAAQAVRDHRTGHILPVQPDQSEAISLFTSVWAW